MSVVIQKSAVFLVVVLFQRAFPFLLVSQAESPLLEQNRRYPSVTLNVPCNTQISHEATANSQTCAICSTIITSATTTSLIKTIRPSVVWCLPSSCLSPPPPSKTLTASQKQPEVHLPNAFPKGFPTLSIIIALLAEVVGQLSDCYRPHYTDSRTQLSSRFHEGECHTSKPPHLWAPHDSADRAAWRELMLVLIMLFITSA